MSKEEMILAALSCSNGSSFSPVQIQKLLFLIDRRIGRDLGGPFFNFVPYHYGPFDKSIYLVLDRLVGKGLMDELAPAGLRWNLYRPTSSGKAKGEQVLSSMRSKPRKDIADLARYVLQLSFDDLVSAVYKAYPDMEANSIYKAER